MPKPDGTMRLRHNFYSHLRALAHYWADEKNASGKSVKERMEGMIFSTLVMFDGGSGNWPSMTITMYDGMVLNDNVSMHDEFSQQDVVNPDPVVQNDESQFAVELPAGERNIQYDWPKSWSAARYVSSVISHAASVAELMGVHLEVGDIGFVNGSSFRYGSRCPDDVCDNAGEESAFQKQGSLIALDNSYRFILRVTRREITSLCVVNTAKRPATDPSVKFAGPVGPKEEKADKERRGERKARKPAKSRRKPLRVTDRDAPPGW